MCWGLDSALVLLIEIEIFNLRVSVSIYFLVILGLFHPQFTVSVVDPSRLWLHLDCFIIITQNFSFSFDPWIFFLSRENQILISPFSVEIFFIFFLRMTENTTPSATVPIVQPWENASSPFFLSSGDNPGVPLVVQHLTEENYNTWSRAILISLDAKTKLGFIDSLVLLFSSTRNLLVIFLDWILH